MNNLSTTARYELTLDSLDLSPGARYPIFLIGIFMYLFGIICNLTLMFLIVLQQSLHKPMYFIMFSLPLNDLVGITSMLPKLLHDIVIETSYTYYPLCVFQAVMLHMSGNAYVFILTAMAFDRYVAICMPLRYNAIMKPQIVIGIVALAWVPNILFHVVLFALQGLHSRCRSNLVNMFCDNPSLIKLTCGNTTVNNIYGLCLLSATQVYSISVQAFSYVKILRTCLATGRSEAKSKAINTCVAQLVIFITFEIVMLFYLLSHRFTHANSNLQKIMGMLIFLVPPILNPIVYGLNSQEIRKHLMKMFQRKISF